LRQNLALPDSVVEKAASIYRKAQQKKKRMSETKAGAMAACVYIAERHRFQEHLTKLRKLVILNTERCGMLIEP
jgi:transcription initiation factor TFIIIB Brf1 subunit/transcription initiation factor TFIIB